MIGTEQASQHPVFFVLALISAVLTIGYFLGNRHNKQLFLAIFEELTAVIKPEHKEYGNIGGSKEYYTNFTLQKESPLARIDAKFTFLPRQLWPYLPIALLIDKYDSLLMALHFKEKLRDEGHIIEADYAKLRKAKIANVDQLNKALIKWGKHDYNIYYRSKKTYDRLKELIDRIDDPGVIRHIALIPGQKKCFIFMIPRKGQVAKDLAPVYQWMLSLD
ncbi:MAG: hypothetical protein Q7I89_07275 [Syntrophales bacterium]|nr:hypothetical protein [Syntrophales bacterium]